MCTLESDEGEYIGSIAGHVNEEAELFANYFVSDEWGGIDNINYYGKAESCAYEELMQKEEIPQGFTTVTITFKNEDEVCGTDDPLRRKHTGGGCAEDFCRRRIYKMEHRISGP